jgi:A/G-specific adenine glycosylase
MDRKRVATLRRKLLAWYAVEARDLPWRQTTDPYAIWVSEIMLQQTRVETVLPYYARFIERFPTVRDLASAPIDDVLKAWEGLGYYRRAHNLRRAAQFVVAEHDGCLPETVAELRQLPGIGPYTAGAIASIAFGLDEAVLDGNVIRVLARLFRIAGDPAKAATKKLLLREAKLLASCGEAAAINQALMDLSARTCLPRSPRCHDCPVASECDAHHSGEEVLFPQKRARKAIPHVDVVAGIVWDGEPFAPGAPHLIARRHDDDMLGGLWEFPGGRVEEGETHEEALVRELQEELAIDVEVLDFFMKVDHAYTHFRVTLHIYHCRHIGGEPQAIDCADWAWVHTDQLDSYAFPTADRRILEALAARNG